ncbi:MAG: DNA mismatch repair endonuclease MutL [Firmicutes bacterium]|nr:DNA mismatch repair endonuclease MutL [Bacillota bacterium]
MIKVLEKHIADKIAAGEVVDRPVSIVKELVENAVDAGATSIVVEMKNGGKSYLRVTDDGCGIPSDQVETAFLRHATSKISNVKDLDAIGTLGFRGEALASIGAVSRTEILTKTRDSKTGTRVLFHGGEVLTHEQTGCPDGTTLIVTDLFYNTPARLKFLKSDSAESGMIIDFLSQMALAYKDIKFRLINNGNVLFATNGDGNRFNTIVRVYKNVDPKNLTAVNYEEGKLKLEGYISTPAQSKNSRSSQIFFVNGRVVHSKVMEKGLMEGYRERIFEGRHPVAYLFLETDPADLDVNIHPNKREVRFDKEADIIDFMTRAIRSCLNTEAAMVSGTSLFKENTADYKEEAKKEKQVDIKSFLSTKVKEDTFEYKTPERPDPAPVPKAEQVKPASPIRPITPITPIVPVKPAAPVAEKSTAEIPVAAPADYKPQTTIVKRPEPAEPKLTVKPAVQKPFDFDELMITGSIFNTYITAVSGDTFYLIDQHAAHERVFYEKLVKEYEEEEKTRQPIMIPLIINVDLKTDEDKFSWLTALTKMGYTIGEFGQGSYRISEIPTFMTLEEAEDFAGDFIEQISDSTNLRNTVIIEKLIMKSCKAAVKGGDSLSLTELQALINDLKNCVNPFSCPHGRPTFVKLTKYEIERLFKRIQN